MRKTNAAVLNCAGAVIGAGFASGREIASFFSRYGGHSWWLIGMAALIMTGLCALCMAAAGKEAQEGEWYVLFHDRRMPEYCSAGLMIITAGAMISAGGHMTALLWNHHHAYTAGVLGTLLAAWKLGHGRMKLMSAVSGALSFAMLCALLWLMSRQPVETAAIPSSFNAAELAAAAVHAAGYAAMNMMLAIGMVCRQARNARDPVQTAGLFGWLIGVLMLLSNCVYTRYPETADAAFPIVRLLAAEGRNGYLFSVVILYLSVLTTLASILYALRKSAEKRIERKGWQKLVFLGLPLAASGIGFTDLVDRLYAPAGLVCLAAVFLPLMKRWYAGKGKTIFP